jgi:hypothetical protein
MQAADDDDDSCEESVNKEEELGEENLLIPDYEYSDEEDKQYSKNCTWYYCYRSGSTGTLQAVLAPV